MRATLFQTCPTCGDRLRARTVPPCARCRRTAVVTVEQMQPHKQQLLAHAERIGLRLPVPTRILLARPGQVFPPEASRGVGHVGDTRWTTVGSQVRGPITIRIAGGLPAHVFRKTLAHEYGHAAVASSGAGLLPLAVLEGFAECVAADLLRTLPDDRLSRAQLVAMEQRVDPVYGDGYRRVARAVAQHGLVTVADVVRRGGAGTEWSTEASSTPVLERR